MEALPDLASLSDSDLKALIKQLELERTVVFAGTTKEPWEVYRRADVVAMASISEGFPYALIESMLSGAAIAATDVGGVREALGSTGVLVAPADPSSMAKAITALLSSQAERRRLGAMARARALQYFTEDKFVEQYRECYQRLSAARRAPRPASRAVVRPFPVAMTSSRVTVPIWIQRLAMRSATNAIQTKNAFSLVKTSSARATM